MPLFKAGDKSGCISCLFFFGRRFSPVSSKNSMLPFIPTNAEMLVMLASFRAEANPSLVVCCLLSGVGILSMQAIDCFIYAVATVADWIVGR